MLIGTPTARARPGAQQAPDSGAIRVGVLFNWWPANAHEARPRERHRGRRLGDAAFLVAARLVMLSLLSRSARGFRRRLGFSGFALLLLGFGPVEAQDDQLVVLREFRQYLHGRSPAGPLLLASDQRLYGVAEHGGGHNGGTLYSLTADGGMRRTLLHFPEGDVGPGPRGTLAEGADGRIYGVTTWTVYSVKRDGSDVRMLIDGLNTSINMFTSAPIQTPGGSWVGLAADGFGTTPGGGIYSLHASGASFQIIHAFSDPHDGATPVGRLAIGSDGRLYGVTQAGGLHGFGTLFAIEANGAGFTVLHHFQAPHGRPRTSLTVAANGNLYGSTEATQPQEQAIVYRLNPTTSEVTMVQLLPERTLVSEFIAARDGRLLALRTRINEGPYEVVAIDPGSGELTLRFTYPRTESDFVAPSALTELPSGMLIAVEHRGGSGVGSVYRFAANGTAFTTIHEFGFESPDGFEPSALTPGTDGRLYGNTRRGGNRQGGTLFSLKPNGSAFKVLHHLDRATEGATSHPTLLRGGGGKWFGSTETGGSGGGGTIYSFDPGKRTFRVLRSYSVDETWTQPERLFFQGSDGRLYGTTRWDGVVFSMKTDGSNYRVLRQDGDPMYGRSPSGLVEISPGKFVGVMAEGGLENTGVAYRFEGNGRHLLVSVMNRGPNSPRHPETLMRGSSGRLYGISEQALFAIPPNQTWNATVIHRFHDPLFGTSPKFARLLEASDTRLYGSTTSGGAFDQGTVYSIDQDGKTFTVHDDVPATFGLVAGPLSEGPDGRIYGASLGGVLGGGTLFTLHRSLRIVAQPLDLVLATGQAGELRVGASGPGPLEFRWYLNGKRLLNPRGAVLKFNAASAANAGAYHVTVTGRGKTVTSAVANVQVTPPAL